MSAATPVAAAETLPSPTPLVSIRGNGLPTGEATVLVGMGCLQWIQAEFLSVQSLSQLSVKWVCPGLSNSVNELQVEALQFGPASRESAWIRDSI